MRLIIAKEDEIMDEEEFQEEEPDLTYVEDLEEIKKDLEKQKDALTKTASKLAKIIDTHELDLRDPENTMIKNSLAIAVSIIKTNVTDIDRVAGDSP